MKFIKTITAWVDIYVEKKIDNDANEKIKHNNEVTAQLTVAAKVEAKTDEEIKAKDDAIRKLSLKLHNIASTD